MKRVAIVVEGQTEQRFIQEILGPYLAERDTHAEAIITKTSRTGRGGGGWRGYGDLLDSLTRQPHWGLVTTLLDHFEAPMGMPGRDLDGNGAAHAAELRQAAILDAYPDAVVPFEPFLIVHEFEALVIAAGALQDSVLGDASHSMAMRRWVAAAGGQAEAVNGGSNTAPSKRLAEQITDYSKIATGLEILRGVPLDDLLPSVPRFQGWVHALHAS